MASEIGKAFEQSADGFVGIVPGEIIGTKVCVVHAIPEHVVGSREHGSGHRENGFLGAAPGFDAQELGVQITGLNAYSGPGRRHQSGLEPVSALAHSVLRRLPALSSLRGHRPAQEIRWPESAKRVMSTPISANRT